MYFSEAIFDENYNCREIVDLESLEALFYLYILGFINAPKPTREFWEYFLDSEPENLDLNLELFGSLPAIPDSLYDYCDAVIGARSLAGAWTKNQKLMRNLVWDRQLLYTGIGGFYWQDSRSPRSSVASNREAPQDLLEEIFVEELEYSSGYSDYPQTVFWRLACNPNAPQKVLSGIVDLIEGNRIIDEFAQLELLIGEPDDYAFGLINNPSIEGELRIRVEKLVKDRGLDPREFEIMSD